MVNEHIIEGLCVLQVAEERVCRVALWVSVNNKHLIPFVRQRIAQIDCAGSFRYAPLVIRYAKNIHYLSISITFTYTCTSHTIPIAHKKCNHVYVYVAVYVNVYVHVYVLYKNYSLYLANCG